MHSGSVTCSGVHSLRIQEPDEPTMTLIFPHCEPKMARTRVVFSAAMGRLVDNGVDNAPVNCPRKGLIPVIDQTAESPSISD